MRPDYFSPIVIISWKLAISASLKRVWSRIKMVSHPKLVLKVKEPATATICGTADHHAKMILQYWGASGLG